MTFGGNIRIAHSLNAEVNDNLPYFEASVFIMYWGAAYMTMFILLINNCTIDMNMLNASHVTVYIFPKLSRDLNCDVYYTFKSFHA